ncbi:MAG TPA: WXG100 family type VII secretion target [Ktedonobacterales bacterium]|nr:WXG100 family type VII secretion target [Ktedonobacterales bacterium]
MADIDLGRLQALVGELQQKSKRFSDAAQQLIDQTYQLDAAAQDFADSATSWAGKGSQVFLSAWMRYHGDTLRSAVALDSTSQVLGKLAQKLEEHAQKIQDLQNQETGGFLLTLGLGLLSVAQLGLDPVSDAATGAAGVGDAAIMEEIATEEEAIAELDSEIGAELEQIASQIDSDTELGLLSNDAMTPELDSLSTELEDEELLDLEDADGMFAKGKGPFRNPVNLDSMSTPENMPPGLKNPEGQYWIQQIEGKGIRVEWNMQAQVQLENDNAYGGAYNYNPAGASGDPNLVVVALSPDATPATVYEEYLHVEAAEARGWAPLGDTGAKLAEEIQVEYQVLENADSLNMSTAEYNDLANLRQSYIDKLKALYEQQGLAWPPADIEPYLQNPPRPGS